MLTKQSLSFSLIWGLDAEVGKFLVILSISAGSCKLLQFVSLEVSGNKHGMCRHNGWNF